MAKMKFNESSGFNGISVAVCTDREDCPSRLNEGVYLIFRDHTIKQVIKQTEALLAYLKRAEVYCADKKSVYDDREGVFLIADESE